MIFVVFQCFQNFSKKQEVLKLVCNFQSRMGRPPLIQGPLNFKFRWKNTRSQRRIEICNNGSQIESKKLLLVDIGKLSILRSLPSLKFFTTLMSSFI